MEDISTPQRSAWVKPAAWCEAMASPTHMCYWHLRAQGSALGPGCPPQKLGLLQPLLHSCGLSAFLLQPFPEENLWDLTFLSSQL